MNVFSRAARIAPAVSAVVLMSASMANAQAASAASGAPAPVPAAAAPAAPPALVQARFPEGLEIPLRLDEKISSKTSVTGDKFRISTSQAVTLSDGTIIPAGYAGIGEITSAQKSGALGKGGSLNVKYDYIKIGDVRLVLRGNKGNDGKGSVGSVVALTALFGIGGLFVHGHNVELLPGQALTAFVDQDTNVALPLAPPPPKAPA